jgi:hypothetical protein
MDSTITSMRRWAGNIVRIIVKCKVVVGKPEGQELKHLGIIRIILKWILNRIGACGLE